MLTLAFWPMRTKAMSCGRDHGPRRAGSPRTARSRPAARPAPTAAPTVVTSTRLIRPGSGERSSVRATRAGERRQGRAARRHLGLGGGELVGGERAPVLALLGQSGWRLADRRRGRAKWPRRRPAASLAATAAALSAWIRRQPRLDARARPAAGSCAVPAGARRARRSAPDRPPRASATARLAWEIRGLAGIHQACRARPCARREAPARSGSGAATA